MSIDGPSRITGASGPGAGAGTITPDRPAAGSSTPGGQKPHQSAPGGSGSPSDPTIRQRWRRWRVIVGVAAIVVLIAIVSTLLRTRDQGGDLDPRSYAPTGTHALAALLSDRGVKVETLTAVDPALVRARPGTTLVVVHPDRLDQKQLTAVAQTPADLVLIGAGPIELGELKLGVHPGGSAFDDDVVGPQCDLPSATVAGAVVVGTDAYQLPDGGTGCYPVADGYALVTVEGGGRRVTLLASGTALTNDQLDEQGDAALGLGLLGAHPDITWLAPPLLGPTSADGRPTLTDLLPMRLKWAVLQLVIAVGVIAIWRGRRMGRLVVEALPVVVRQAETVAGRARLYRRARSYDKAAEALRSGTRDRLARRLGFSAGVSHDALVDAIAARTPNAEHGHAGRVNALLYGPTPADDHALVELAQQLTALEQEVVRS